MVYTPRWFPKLRRMMSSMTVDRVPVWVVDDHARFRRAAVELLATTKEFVFGRRMRDR